LGIIDAGAAVATGEGFSGVPEAMHIEILGLVLAAVLAGRDVVYRA
jgi:hypothetical protein